MNQELEKLIEQIKSEKIRSLLRSGEQSPLQRTYIEPALETLAREVLRLEMEAVK